MKRALRNAIKVEKPDAPDNKAWPDKGLCRSGRFVEYSDNHAASQNACPNWHGLSLHLLHDVYLHTVRVYGSYVAPNDGCRLTEIRFERDPYDAADRAEVVPVRRRARGSQRHPLEIARDRAASAIMLAFQMYMLIMGGSHSRGDSLGFAA